MLFRSSEIFGFPLLDLNAYDSIHIIKDAIDPKLVATHRVIPLYKRGNRLSVATADPTNLRALDEIRFQTGLVVDPIIVREDQLTPLAAKLAESADTTLKNLVSESIHLEFDEDQAGEPAPEDDTDVEDAPIVRFIHKVLLDAINDGASDIHFEPYEKSYRIRFRLDGALREIALLHQQAYQKSQK